MKKLLLVLLTTSGCATTLYPDSCKRTELEQEVKGAGLSIPAGTRVESCKCSLFEWAILWDSTKEGGVVLPVCDGKVIPFVGAAKKIDKPTVP